MTIRDLFFKIRYGFRGVPKRLLEEQFRWDERLRRWDFSGEKKFMEAMTDHLRAGMTVLDIGANFGIYTLLSARLVGPRGFVHAFEPMPQNLDYLKRHLYLNHFESSVQVHETAVSHSDAKTIRFQIPATEPGLTVASGIVTDRDQGSSIEVVNSRLDQFREQIDRVDLIKIDVEGAELLVLQGAEQLLIRDHPLILMEVHDREIRAMGGSVSGLRDFLKNLGYQEERIDGCWVGRPGDFHALFRFSNP